MYRRILQSYIPRLQYSNCIQRTGRPVISRPHTTSADYESKYADKLRRRAEEQGLSVSNLKVEIKEEQEERRRRQREAVATSPAIISSSETPSVCPVLSTTGAVRKDSSPVKPLSSILNVSRIMSTPHTSGQISALWKGYHASRSGGTGRGFVCASVPLALYRKMTSAAERYPTFVVPVPRPTDQAAPAIKGEGDTAYEFYLLQWDFHGVPPVPSAVDDPFVTPASTMTATGLEGSNPQTSTILFTPLQEYKSRGTFSAPYLALTHYTDLAQTHGIVLLRGEITPSSNSGRYMLSQVDAQFLSMGVQKFYLWEKGTGEGERLLKCFHNSPEHFKWEELLKYATRSV